MQAKYISYQNTHAFSKLVVDYINDVPDLKDFYAFRPDLAGIAKAIAARNFTGDRALLCSVLKQQYQHIKPHSSVIANINLLSEENSFTVTTGHQLNLFTGPLYFIYKIVTTINLAIELKMAFPDKNFIPVYWMATEDHDFNEINHVQVEDKNISWIAQTNGATGRISTKNVAAAVAAYKGYLGLSKNGKRIAKLVDEAYLKHTNLADATRFLVNSLFERYGLVVINADDKKLKQLFSPIAAADITEQNSVREIDKNNAMLTKAGYNIQVNGREINFFYLKDNLRERIVEKGAGYAVNNTTIYFTRAALLEEIASYPERFSPNVVMRPLYQEVVLPNIAYVGGGAEIAYWLQLKANFDFYKIDFPVLLLRNSALVIDKRSADNLKNAGFAPEDIFLPAETLKQKWIIANSDAQLHLDDERQAINAAFALIKSNATKIDKTLAASAESAAAKTTHLLDQLEKKLFRAEKRKHEYILKQIENTKQRLFPGGILQERVVNIAPMYVNYGEDFISSLIERFDPLGGDFTLLLP